MDSGDAYQSASGPARSAFKKTISEMTHEEQLAESKRRQMTPLKEKLGESL